MSSIHNDLIRQHRRILKQRLNKYNAKNNTKYKLAQKNIDLLFYINYINFLKVLSIKAKQIATIEGSSEIMNQHWEESSDSLLMSIEKDNTLQ